MFCQQQQPEFHAESASHSGRQLLEAADDSEPGKLVCNITGKMFLYMENITITKDGKSATFKPDEWQCSATDCPDKNNTVYVWTSLYL